MKKLAFFALTVMSVAGYVKAETTKVTAQEAQPKLALRVFDTSSKVARPLAKNELSISQKHELCWIAFDMPFQAMNNVTEVFQTPEASKYSAPNAVVTSSKDNKTHTITSTRKVDSNGNLSNCWKFDNSDPKGKHTLSVRINDIIFPAQSFEIVK